MADISVVNMSGDKTGTITLSDAVFGIEPNKTAMHMAVVNHLANRRQGTQSTKTRTEVRGGGKKPWRQKGTGHARQGSIRSPQWRHGGIALGPKPRSYRFSLNKKVRQLAIKSALSSKAASGELTVIDDIALASYRTKDILTFLKAVEAPKKVLIILTAANADTDDAARDSLKKVIKSAANIQGVKTAGVNELNTYDILNCGKLIIVKDAIGIIEGVYA